MIIKRNRMANIERKERRALLLTSNQVLGNNVVFAGNNIKERPKLFVFVSSSDEADLRVYLSGSDFKEIFAKKRADCKFPQYPKIVKISRSGTKKCIYRQYACSSSLKRSLSKDYVGLSYNSMLGLCSSDDDFKSIDKLELSGSSLWKYYIFYPLPITRITIWLSIFAIIVGMLSLILSCSV